jgi:hypothetical protein
MYSTSAGGMPPDPPADGGPPLPDFGPQPLIPLSKLNSSMAEVESFVIFIMSSI